MEILLKPSEKYSVGRVRKWTKKERARWKSVVGTDSHQCWDQKGNGETNLVKSQYNDSFPEAWILKANRKHKLLRKMT